MRELRTFVVTYPCWALVHRDSIVRDTSGKPVSYTSPIKFLMLDDRKGGTTLPLFTDADLASRFKKESGGMEDMKVVAVTSPKMLVETLEMARGAADAMSFDQPKLGARPYAIWPLEYAIQRIEAGQPL
jgi:hypothetical protein